MTSSSCMPWKELGFLVYVDWIWYGITILWTWQTNCMGTMEGFSRSDRYFYQTITLWRNLNQRFRSNWTFHWSHVWRDLSAQNCWQMPQVFIYTDGSCNGKLPTYTRCLAETRLAGDVTVRNMSRLHDTGRSWSKLADSGGYMDDEGEQQPVCTTLPKASQAFKDLKHCSCKGLCVRDSSICKRYNLACTYLCHCQGQCVN